MNYLKILFIIIIIIYTNVLTLQRKFSIKAGKYSQMPWLHKLIDTFGWKMMVCDKNMTDWFIIFIQFLFQSILTISTTLPVLSSKQNVPESHIFEFAKA